jgi:hypothetical protein
MSIILQTFSKDNYKNGAILQTFSKDNYKNGAKDGT